MAHAYHLKQLQRIWEERGAGELERTLQSRHLNALVRKLHEDETIIWVERGTVGTVGKRVDGVLVLTDTRLLLGWKQVQRDKGDVFKKSFYSFHLRRLNWPYISREHEDEEKIETRPPLEKPDVPPVNGTAGKILHIDAVSKATQKVIEKKPRDAPEFGDDFVLGKGSIHLQIHDTVETERTVEMISAAMMDHGTGFDIDASSRRVHMHEDYTLQPGRFGERPNKVGYLHLPKENLREE